MDYLSKLFTVKDLLTLKGFTKEQIEEVNKKIKGSNKSYIIASVNIENFSIFTKWHGAEECLLH